MAELRAEAALHRMRRAWSAGRLANGGAAAGYAAATSARSPHFACIDANGGEPGRLGAGAR